MLLLALVLLAQLLVLFLSAPRSYSGSDAGGRAAAVAAAADRGSCDHDLGYWAAPWDPTARVHPMVNTLAVDDRFVQPSAILFVCAASPLASTFGLDGALVLSIAGVLAAAAGAWMLERTFGGSGTWSLVLVGLIGPVAFYGTDIWEHALAAGAALLGTGLLVRGLGREGRWRLAALSGGLLWGLAVTLRTETALVAVSLGVAFVLIGDTRGRVMRAWREVLVSISAVGAILILDAWLEATVIGTGYRTDRAGGRVSGATDASTAWINDVAATTVGFVANDTDVAVMAYGGLFVLAVLVLGAAIATTRVSPSNEVVVAVVIGALLVGRLARGLGFVPGMLTAAPVAVIGLWTLRQRAAPVRAVALGAILCLPAVWALQWRGNLIAQWGGRYVLLSGALLTVCGVVELDAHPRRWVRTVLLGAAVAVGLFGTAWKVDRSHVADEVISDLEEVSCDDVLVITEPFIPREGGAHADLREGRLGGDCRFLSARPGDLSHALDVAQAVGVAEVTVLTSPLGDGLVASLGIEGVRDVGSLHLGTLQFRRFEVPVHR